MLTPSEIQTIVRDSAQVRVRGAGTKSRIDARSASLIDMSALRGVIDYQPNEFIIQAYAGTPLREVNALLAERGQYLPFDPLLAGHGATLGGTVAANASGPERYRYGGVRDFIIGCHFVDGNGDLLSGGGKVVKNAAGFDYPKLFVGSMGALAVLTDVCFKVFPRPEAYNTLRLHCATREATLTALYALTGAPLDIHALDVASEQNGHVLEVRVGGLSGGMDARMNRVRALAGGGDVYRDDADSGHWRAVREFDWAGNWSSGAASVVKVPVTPERLAACEQELGAFGARRYSVGANVAWLSVPAAQLDAVDAALRGLGWQGRVYLGKDAGRTLGVRPANVFAQRVRQALDPRGVFNTVSAEPATV